MPPPSTTERELEQLAAELKGLENDYTTFFAGRSARPPLVHGRRWTSEPDGMAGRAHREEERGSEPD